MPGAGLFGLPLTLFTETLRWTHKQLQRQDLFFELTLLRPDPQAQWTTPNEITLDLPCLRLRSFGKNTPSPSPSTDDTSVSLSEKITGPSLSIEDIPTLIITPQVNSSYICDYAPGQSLAATLMEQGYNRVYATDWKSATHDRAEETLDDVFGYLRQCVEHLGGRVRIVGLCQGGWMGLMYAALFPEEVTSLILAAAPVDFHAEPGLVNWMAWFYPMAFYQWLVASGGGIMRGEWISGGFNNMRMIERYVVKYIDLYNHLDDQDFVERYKRLDNWYALHQHIPGATYLQIVRELFKENRLIKGTLRCLNRQVDLADVVAPLYLIAGTKDHITLPGQLFAAEQYVSSPVVRRYMADAGHIGVFMATKTLQETWPQVVAESQNDERNSMARPSEKRSF